MATLFRGFSTVDKVKAPYQDIELVKRDLLNEFYNLAKGERVMRPNPEALFGLVNEP